MTVPALERVKELVARDQDGRLGKPRLGRLLDRVPTDHEERLRQRVASVAPKAIEAAMLEAGKIRLPCGVLHEGSPMDDLMTV